MVLLGESKQTCQTICNKFAFQNFEMVSKVHGLVFDAFDFCPRTSQAPGDVSVVTSVTSVTSVVTSSDAIFASDRETSPAGDCNSFCQVRREVQRSVVSPPKSGTAWCCIVLHGVASCGIVLHVMISFSFGSLRNMRRTNTPGTLAQVPPDGTVPRGKPSTEQRSRVF